MHKQRNKMKKTITCMAALMAMAAAATAQDATYTVNPETGSLASITIEGDTAKMDWTLRTDGSQYAWVTGKYGWGLGYLTANGQHYEWRKPETTGNGGGPSA